MRNWNIEVSNDKENWIVIDERINDPSLNGPAITKYFQVKDKIDSFYFSTLKFENKKIIEYFYIYDRKQQKKFLYCSTEL